MIGILKLRPYQKQAVNKMVNNKVMINASECGLGKTIEVIKSIEEVNPKRVLILCPKHLRYNWQDEIDKWTGWESTVFKGEVDERPKIFKKWRKKKYYNQPQILIMNFYYLEEVKEYLKTWEMVIIDEYHTAGLRNQKTKFFKNAKKLRFEYAFLLSGTPITKGLQDLYAPLNFLNRSKFRGYWQFCRKYSVVTQDYFGHYEVSGFPKNQKEWNKDVLEPYTIRDKVDDKLDELPDKSVNIIPVEMGEKQSKIYNDIKEELMYYDEDTDRLITTSTQVASLIRLRQILNTPYNLDLDFPGESLKAIIEKINEIHEMGDCGCIYTPFKSGFDKIEEYIKKKTPINKVYKIHGNMKKDSNDVVKEFQNHDGNDKIILGTVKTANGYTVTDANHVMFLGASYDPNNNAQAEGRIHRMGQKKLCNIYYYVYKDTIHERLMEILRDKTINISLSENE